jgi:hypothetical protein
MSEYGEITLGSGESSRSAKHFADSPVVIDLNGLRPYMWSGAVGVGLVNGATWGKCPDCEGECVWF